MVVYCPQRIVFRCNESKSKKFPLCNSGNIDIDISLEVVYLTDLFQVIPDKLFIKSGEVVDIEVRLGTIPLTTSTKFNRYVWLSTDSLLSLPSSIGKCGFEPHPFHIYPDV